MASIDVDVTFDDIATLCEESQDELADLLLQEEPFYSFIKSEPSEDFGNSTEAPVENSLHCGMDVRDISHEETCCSNDCYNTEARSPDSDGSMSHLSPDNRRKSSSSRKNRTPNTLRHIMEKHRHSERIRHHSLNEQLKAICLLVPGSAEDNRETKVVMMQRVISYIAFLENSIKFLCWQLGSKPHPSWVLLTDNFSNYFRDYFKGIEDTDVGDDEVLAATKNLAGSMKEQDDNSSSGSGRLKVSSPTVDSTTDYVVPVMVPPAEKEVTVRSQDSTVPSSSVAGDDDHIAHVWTISSNQEIVSIGETHGDTEVFFSSSVDDNVSAVLEISSSTNDNNVKTSFAFAMGRAEDAGGDRDAESGEDRPFVPAPRPRQHSSAQNKPINSFFSIHRHMMESDSKSIPRRNKRKQLSPRRSSCDDDDYLTEKAYLPSWSTGTLKTVPLPTDGDRSPCKVRVLPYNIRCNHRHPVQRLQATRAKLGVEGPGTLVQVVRPLPEPNRVATPETQDKLKSKLDLRKTSWMNGFMMFSRLNRRKFIEAHPGVHTSHISKIMGHAWRNMGREEQAPYKEKAKLCSQELYRAYTSQPEFTLFSPVAVTPATSTADASFTTPTSLMVKPEPVKTD